jgi:hypothetical protein
MTMFLVKLNLCQYDFTKSKSSLTDLVTCLDFVTLLVCSQREADAIYVLILAVLLNSFRVPCFLTILMFVGYLLVMLIGVP